ncbi:EAL domain-containing protein [Paenibacillus paeoniae]|uniref:EAL domain-containing protein n=1 Tax=Paenibacillus paeoniae TaxID=2292705 RepID=A0A371P0F3_9BACL|nr:EAL domain-containing protein [Paenibacillus paeoniae]REK69414.1 EAL domain-containing protein [Paenibacillus paeoniae]
MNIHNVAGAKSSQAYRGNHEYAGVVYLSWERLGEGTDRGSDLSVREQWRKLAEQELPAAFRDMAQKLEWCWRNDDLFLRVKLHGMERVWWESLLEQTAFSTVRKMELAMGIQQDKGHLYVGTAVLECQTYNDTDTLWYEATKKAVLHGQFDGDMKRNASRKALQHILAERLIYPVYQPIVALGEEPVVFGYEALTRLRDSSEFHGPVELFRFAGEAGRMYSLDRMAREEAIGGCVKLEPNQKLFINVMAQIMEDPSFSPGQTLSFLEAHHLKPNQIVFEITERSSIEDYPAVKKALQHYRKQGYQIAIDDVGAGYSSLQSIVELRPDYLKIDRSIIHRIHRDDVKAHILHTLQEVGAKLGVPLIAEGIERQEELDVLTRMGVQYAQGYYLGRPGPFPA